MTNFTLFIPCSRAHLTFLPGYSHLINKKQTTMSSFVDDPSAKRSKGFASILAIGTANPETVWYQDGFPDFYFKMANCEDQEELKQKFKRICEKSMVRKRHTYMTEKFFKENPNVLTYGARSLDARLDVELVENPKLGAEAAAKAIKEWGQPASSITHLIFHSYSGVQMPGADYKLVKYLGLKPSVKRFMIYHNGCFAGGTVLRLAKDIAENNAGARVLVVCSETMLNGFHAPSNSRFDHLVAYAIFGDGAAAAVVGADPDMSIEHPLFQMITANQTLVPESDGALSGRYQEIGFVVTLGKDVPTLVSSKIEDCLVEAFNEIGVTDWNSLFYAIHPGGAAILNAIEAKLNLTKEKLEATRHVLSEYGNMSSPSVIFVLDEMRKRSYREQKTTTGDGLEWGVLFGIGPGLTVETIVLRSCATQSN